MLVSLTRVGASRQTFAKAFAVVGVDPGAVRRAFRTSGASAVVECGRDDPRLFTVRSRSSWIGTRTARDAAFTELAGQLTELAAIARRCGARLVPTAVAVGGVEPVLGGEEHVIAVASAIEQEVLCNLLRAHVPALIAMTGRGITGAGRAPDRIGSRWLADSRTHLATRFLASTAEEYLDRVKADLRRREGVAQLDRMDVAPTTGADGGPAVVVRCLDAAIGLAGLRMQAVVLAAVAMRARRLVRAGEPADDTPQRLLEQNRARAVTTGLRARFVEEGSEPATAVCAVRALLVELAPEFRNLEVAVEELAPVLLPVEMGRFGGRRNTGEGGLLKEWASAGDPQLLDRCQRALTDDEPGGVQLRQARTTAGGTVAAVLRAWRERIEGAAPGAAAADPRPAHRGAGR